MQKIYGSKKEQTDNILTAHQTNKINSFLKAPTRTIFSPPTDNQKRKSLLIEGGEIQRQLIQNASKELAELDNISPKRNFNIQDKKMPVVYISNQESQEQSKNTQFLKIPDFSQNKKEENLNDSYEVIQGKDISPPSTISVRNSQNSFEVYNTFCQGIFISGLNCKTKTSDVIKGSEKLLAPCGHRECSFLPGTKAEILQLYIKKNLQEQPEISNVVAGMCFPLGIKPCFYCNFDNKKKITHTPKPQQTFFNVIKNEKEEIFYIATLQYFVKLNKKEFEKNYAYNSLNYFINKEWNPKANNINDKKIQEVFQTLSHLMINDTVLIPESVSLISKYPYYSQMDTCLKCIIGLPKSEMNLLISHIINEIPLPPLNKQIQFYVPRTSQPLTLCNYKCGIKENISQLNLCILFDNFTIENIILIFHLIILEQKILFVDNNYKLLSEISFIFTNLIYPFIWINPYVPVLSLSTVKFLQSFIPFIMGSDEYLIKYSEKMKFLRENDDIVLVAISKKIICLIKNRKKTDKKEILKGLNIPDLPNEVIKFLSQNLKELKKLYQKKNNENTQEQLNKKLTDIFIKSMIILIGDYKNYTFITNNDMPLFNKEAFIQAHPQKDSKLFLEEMISTQIFNQFLFNQNGLNPKSKSNFSNIDYFMSMISTNTELVNVQQVRKRSNSVREKSKPKNTSRNYSKGVIPNHINSSFHSKNSNNIVTFRYQTMSIGSRDSSMAQSEKKQINKYLITPYFIANPLINLNSSKIGEYITNSLKKKFLNDISSEEQHCFIISNQKEYQFELVKQMKFYPIILSSNNDKAKNRLSFSKTNNNSPISLQKKISFELDLDEVTTAPSKEESINSTNRHTKDQDHTIKKSISLSNLSEATNEENKDYIFLTECFKNICTSKQKLKPNQFEKIDTILHYPSARGFLAKLIFPESSISNEENHKQLTLSSYTDFLKLMKIALYYTSMREKAVGRLYTLACFSYYKVEKNEMFRYIYEDLIIGAYPTKVWIEENFWIEFFKGELNDSLKENQSDIVDCDNNSFEQWYDENEIEEALLTVGDIMTRLNLNRNFVKKILFTMIIPNYHVNEDKINELQDKFNNY